MDPLISVIVVNWNTRALLDSCIKSVFANRDDTSIEVWVVDNASTDDSVGFLKSNYPDVGLIVNTENIGFARANNQALDRCRGKYALLLNSDAQLLPMTLGILVERLEAEPRAAAVAPMLVNVDGSFQDGPKDEVTLLSETLLASGLNRYLRRGYYPGYTADAPAGPYAWVSGTCLLIRRAAWFQVGKLDPGYFMYTEEVDWCWRARQSGWTIWYEPTSRVLHLGGASSKPVAAAMRAQLYKSKLLFFIKHRPRWQALALRTILLVTSFVKVRVYTALGRFVAPRERWYDERAGSFRQVYETIRTVPIPAGVD